jgi:DNA-binding HxlR family transcriptional regulator
MSSDYTRYSREVSTTYPTDCPVAATLDELGDRWTLLIVRDLLRGITRYSDLSRSLAPIAPNLLAGRLRRLEESGIVTREVYSRRPLRADYRLTERGHALAPVVITLGRFGIDHLGRPEPDYLAAHVGCGGRVPPTAWRCLRCGEDVAADALELRPPSAILGPAGPA